LLAALRRADLDRSPFGGDGIFHAEIARDAKTGEVLEASNVVELILTPQ
jgi:hypothetical protein